MALAMSSLTVVGEVLDLPALAAYDTVKLAYEHRDTIRPMIQERLPRSPLKSGWSACWRGTFGAQECRTLKT